MSRTNVKRAKSGSATTPRASMTPSEKDSSMGSMRPARDLSSASSRALAGSAKPSLVYVAEALSTRGFVT